MLTARHLTFRKTRESVEAHFRQSLPEQLHKKWQELDLASSLFHSGSVSPATFAAFPYLLEIASRTNTDLRIEILYFMACIVKESRSAGSTIIPSFLKQSFDLAASSAEELIIQTLGECTLPEQLFYLFLSLATIRGYSRLIEELENIAHRFEPPFRH